MKRQMYFSDNAIRVHPRSIRVGALQNSPVLLVAVHQERSCAVCVFEEGQGVLTDLDVHSQGARSEHIDDIDAQPARLGV